MPAGSCLMDRARVPHDPSHGRAIDLLLASLEWLDIIIVQRHRISSLNCHLNVTMDHQSVISRAANEQGLGPYTLQRGG